MQDISLTLNSIFDSVSLVQEEVLLFELEKATEVLEKENTAYRKKCGGLLDFRKFPCTTILVPDIHARWFFLKNILDFEVDTKEGKKTILQALQSGNVRVICLGDAFHSESPQYQRWQKAYREFLQGDYCGKFMTEEMQDNMKVLRIILALKTSFPEHFHFLKGNHDNIMNETTAFDRGFYKFCQEGEQVRLFLETYYDDLLLHSIGHFEKFLPIIATGKGFVASHAEPRHFYKEKDLIDYRKGSVIYDLTWTQNDVVEIDTARQMIRQFFPTAYSKKGRSSKIGDPLYFAGHRAVQGNFALRQEGVFVQLHNPLKQNIAVIKEDGSFCLEKDIVCVDCLH